MYALSMQRKRFQFAPAAHIVNLIYVVVCVCNRRIQHPVHRSTIDGTLYTTLPEDVFTLIESQTNLLDEFLRLSNLSNTPTGDAVAVDGLRSILRIMNFKQMHYRESFLDDMESCIAASNDFMRMSERAENMMRDARKRYPQLGWDASNNETMLSEWDVTTGLVEQDASKLLDRFGTDAVLASQRAVLHLIHSIHQTDIPLQLFSRPWEDELTHNEVARAIIRSYNDSLLNIRQYLATEYMFQKVIASLVRSTICYYVQCLVLKADRLRRGKKAGEVAFLYPARAITRMTYDIQVFRDFFRGLAKHNSTLKRIVDDEFDVFNVLLECMISASSRGAIDNMDEFILVIHKRTGANSDITRFFLSDIYVLIGNKNEHLLVEKSVRRLQKDLDIITSRMAEKRDAFPAAAGSSAGSSTTSETSHFRLDHMLQTVYEDRLLQERLSLCGNLFDEVRGLGGSKPIAMTAGASEDPGRSSLKWPFGFDSLKRMFGVPVLK